MEQRRLRLGDILDDYCPRERRVTNHAVVAMIEQEVKQTRCTTCDAEHAYKGARVPKRRKKETPAALYNEVLAGMPEAEGAPAVALAVPALAVPAVLPATLMDVVAGPVMETAPVGSVPALTEDFAFPMQSDQPDPPDDLEAADRPDDEPAPVDGPVHRPLIRATLPRPEGVKDARPAPDFTIRQTSPRGHGNGHGHHGGFRGDRMRMRAGGQGNGNGNREVNGNRASSGNGPRFHGGRPSGSGRAPSGRAGGPPGFRGNGGPGGKRGRGGPRG